jgi:hypothetical protein
MRKVCDMCGGAGKRTIAATNDCTSIAGYETCPMCGGRGIVDDMVQQTNGVVGLSMSADEIQKIIESRIREKVDAEFSSFQNQSIRNSRHYDPRMQEIVEDQIRRILTREFYPKMSEYIKAAMIRELPTILRLAVYDYFPDLPKDGDDK